MGLGPLLKDSGLIDTMLFPCVSIFKHSPRGANQGLSHCYGMAKPRINTPQAGTLLTAFFLLEGSTYPVH